MMRSIDDEQIINNPDDARRVVVECVTPRIDCGRFPVKRVVGDVVKVRARIFADSHYAIQANVVHAPPRAREWSVSPMRDAGNDEWEGGFRVEQPGMYRYCVEGWIDRIGTWRKDIARTLEAGRDVTAYLLFMARHFEFLASKASDGDAAVFHEWAATLGDSRFFHRAVTLAQNEELSERAGTYRPDEDVTTFDRELYVIVDRERARFSAWYEFFPRSRGPDGAHGGFRDCEKCLSDIAAMGFDVVYLPPIHPIGKTNRKGKNNTLSPSDDAVGSPWAIGSDEGGHTSVDPALGSLEDFDRFVSVARGYGLEIALDFAVQASPDHPYLTEHPEWFRRAPDGTVMYAENPPKRYEDIVPFDFDTPRRRELWEELRRIVLFWIGRGIRIFRVDNPHTKPFALWEWLLGEVRRKHPDVIFLSEAFARPSVMLRLAKLGFSQSYTYFTWRNTPREVREYVSELAGSDMREYFRPHFWPATPDILPLVLQRGGRAAFMLRFALAATLSSNYGIYGPAFEQCESEALAGKEEYADSEKYRIRRWDRGGEGGIAPFIARINRIRRENRALQRTENVVFGECDNGLMLVYVKYTEDPSETLVIAASFDPFVKQCGSIRLPQISGPFAGGEIKFVEDLLDGSVRFWCGERHRVELDPEASPVSILKVIPEPGAGTSYERYGS